jgi:hypothetical protein
MNSQLMIDENEVRYALTPYAEQRLSWALFSHDPEFLDQDEAARILKRAQDTGDSRELNRFLARAVDKFIEHHKQSGHSCVEGIDNVDALILSMVLLKMNYLLRAGDVDAEGNLVQ